MKLNEIHRQRIGLAVQAANAGHVVCLSVQHGETDEAAKLVWVEFRPGMRAQNHVIAAGTHAQMYSLSHAALEEFERQKSAGECSAPLTSPQESGATSGA